MRDEDELDLDRVDQARGGEAKRGLGDWAKDAIPGSAGYAKLVIEVRDEAGHVVFRGAVSFECTDE